MLANIARILDLLLLSFTFGATVWFFFVQSPILLRWMGKEKFLPLQMKLAKSLFATLAAVVPLTLGLSLVHGQEQFWAHVATAGLASLGALANQFVVGPRALRAGGRALRDARDGEDDRSVAGFASHGGGEASKVWHRLVVVFVVVMLVGVVAHGAVVIA